MAWQTAKLHFLIILHMWNCFQVLQAAFEVNVNCWWNQDLPEVQNVVCRTSVLGRANNCGLCQLYETMSGQRHQLPSTCASSSFSTFNFSVAAEHREHIHCVCNGNGLNNCKVTVRGGCEYNRIDHLPYDLITSGNVLGLIKLEIHMKHTRIPEDPPFPTRPNCAIEDLAEDIYCSWTTINEPVFPTTYTLHWQDNNGNYRTKESDRENAVIRRTEYMKNTKTTVWVTARNALGYAQSEESVFNTGQINRPDPPYSIIHSLMPLEIFWSMDCDIMGPLGDSCQVQYRHDQILDWTEIDDCQTMFLLEDPQPFTVYRFRVRCHCGYEEKVMSNWSSVHSVRTPPAAPVGPLDVWTDCAPNLDKFSCNVYWKEMPPSQARGEVTDYIVTLKLKNGTEIKQSRDTETQQFTEQHCPQIRHFTLKPGVMGVFVSAETSVGTSRLTLMPFPVRGQTTPEVILNVIGKNQTLLVSWSVHTQFSESVLEYVVQHVSNEPHPQCLNWVRVKRNQSSATLTGHFRNYTAYNVSLFAVFTNYSIFLKSAIAYTLQGAPPKVPQLYVKDISDSSATLMWSPIPLHESKGVILHYLVGVNETGSNMTITSTSVDLRELQPLRQYQAWVSAVSAAGEGAKSVTTFSTTDNQSIVPITVSFSILLLVLFLTSVIGYKLYKSLYCFDTIPDPMNSKPFKHMSLQHVWPWFYYPSELTLKISDLEIVQNLHPNAATETEVERVLIDVEQLVPDDLSGTNEGVGESSEESEESIAGKISKPDSWRKEYSEMVDTDEEKENSVGDGEWWDQNCVSDYERHFMPSVEANELTPQDA